MRSDNSPSFLKLGDGPERRKLMYQRTQTENYNRKHKKSPIDEERALHESYQIILKVSKVKFTVYKYGVYSGDTVYKYMSRPKKLLLNPPLKFFNRTGKRYVSK